MALPVLAPPVSHTEVQVFCALPDAHLNELVSTWLLGCGGTETRKAYAQDFREFCEFLQGSCGLSWENLIGLGAAAYAAFVKARGEHREIAPATAARKLASVSSFFEFCGSLGVLSRNPYTHIKRPRAPKQPKSAVLSDAEVRALRERLRLEMDEAVKSGRKAFIQAARFNHIAIETLLGTGCRVAELLGLRVSDLNIMGEYGKITFHAKGAEEHTPLVARALVAQLLEWSIEQKLSETELIFLKNYSRESVEKRLTRELHRLCKLAGISKHVTPHVLRATVATSLHGKGVPIVHIQKLLNHKDIGTTAIYIRRTGEESEAAGLLVSWD